MVPQYTKDHLNNIIFLQAYPLSATLRLVDSGHILAEQSQASARWCRGLLKPLEPCPKASISSHRPQEARQPSSVLRLFTWAHRCAAAEGCTWVWPERKQLKVDFS